MQIFNLPEIWMIVLFFTLWPVFQVSAAFFCLKLPDRYFSPDGFLYKTRRWEQNGEFYEKAFKVKKWKRFLPTAERHIKRLQKKTPHRFFVRESAALSIESCRAN